jgi:hypothetical protein
VFVALRRVLRLHACAAPEFLETLRLSYGTEDCFCAHGGVDPDVANLKEQSHHALIWGGEGFPEAYGGTALVVYGHRNNATLDANGWPAPNVTGRTIGIDTRYELHSV